MILLAKKCSRCRKQKRLKEFHKGCNKLGCSAYCKLCQREYDTVRHKRPDIRRRTNESDRLVRVERNAWLREFKKKPCKDCGGKFHHSAMHWDHLPQFKKRANVSSLVKHNSKAVVLKEIAKCELVCSNCHAIRGWFRKHPKS